MAAKKPRNASKTDWNKEIGKSGLLVLKVFGKVLTYILNIVMTVLLVALITGTIVGVAFAVYINNYIEVDVSEIEMLATDQDMTTRLYYMDYSDRTNRIGTPVEIENQQLFSSENRTWVSYDEIPTYLIEAFVSIEDERFWTHGGVDWKRTVGATFYFAIGKASYGGSTITQQLIKNVTGDNDVTIQRKVKEIMTALELEKVMSKSQILELYLNTIYLSEHCYGIQAAANAYFEKDVSELTLTECAALAAIPKYPYKYDPYINPDNNKDRRLDVLFKMHELEKITDEEYDTACNTELTISENVATSSTIATTSWYTDAVIDDTIDLLVENLDVTETVASQMIYTGGLKIYTVMDPFVQKTLEDYFADPSNFSKINEGVQPEASMVIIDPETGDLLGLVGGRGEKTSSRILNYATQTTRSPGSSIKPVTVYTPALEYGVIKYGTYVKDSPLYGSWPVNYPAGYRGDTAIFDAVARSVNTVAVKVLQRLGVETAYEFAHDRLGMDSIIYEYTTSSGQVYSDLNLSALGLGGMTFGVTVREITGAYQILCNDGVFTGNRTVIKILDSRGNVIVDNSGKPDQVISSNTASTMTKMLQGVVNYGTASKMTVDAYVNCAGKTGTTSDDCDRWYIGYTPYYLGGVWFGYAMPMSLNGFSETKSPSLEIWDDIMTLLHQPIFEQVKNGEATLEKFGTVGPYGAGSASNSYFKICTVSGLLAHSGCEAAECVKSEYYDDGEQPKTYCTYHDEDDSDEESTEEDESTNDESTSDVDSNTGSEGDSNSEPETSDTEEITENQGSLGTLPSLQGGDE